MEDLNGRVENRNKGIEENLGEPSNNNNGEIIIEHYLEIENTKLLNKIMFKCLRNYNFFPCKKTQ